MKASLITQEARLTVANEELRQAQGQLDEKQRELDDVQRLYDAAMQEKQVEKAFLGIKWCFISVLGLGSIR